MTSKRGVLPGEDLMRASDRDRELAAQVLQNAYADGRLDLDEFLQRWDAAYSAKTWRDLAVLTADLPTDCTFSGAQLNREGAWLRTLRG